MYVYVDWYWYLEAWMFIMRICYLPFALLYIWVRFSAYMSDIQIYFIFEIHRITLP